MPSGSALPTSQDDVVGKPSIDFRHNFFANILRPFPNEIYVRRGNSKRDRPGHVGNACEVVQLRGSEQGGTMAENVGCLIGAAQQLVFCVLCTR